MVEDKLETIVVNVWQEGDLLSGQFGYTGFFYQEGENQYGLAGAFEEEPKTLQKLAKCLVETLAAEYEFATMSSLTLADIWIALYSDPKESDKNILILSSGVYRNKSLSNDDLAILGVEINKEMRPYYDRHKREKGD